MSDHTEVTKLNCVQPLLVCEKTAAKMIGMSSSMLLSRRFRNDPLLPFVRIGRSIRYRVTDIKNFVRCCHSEGGSP